MTKVQEEKLQEAVPARNNDLSILLVTLLKGVQYRDDDEKLWQALYDLQAQVRDSSAVLGLELVFDEAEGYAFLRTRPDSGDDAGRAIPRLIARRPLSFPVSLLLALLRKKLAEFDVAGGDTRLILTLEDIVELLRVFLPESSNEARLIDQVETHLNKIIDLGFLRKFKTSGGQVRYEIRRILKAYVDAHWLTGFDARLAEYQTHLTDGKGVADD